MRTRKATRYLTEIVMKEMLMLEKKSEESDGSPAPRTREQLVVATHDNNNARLGSRFF